MMRYTMFPFVLLFLLFTVVPLWAAPPDLPAAEKVENRGRDADFDAAFADDFSDESDVPLIRDPLESWNRGVFWLNDKLYFYALKPVARAYRVVPRIARTGVRNVFSNLTTPVRLINSTLQLKMTDAAAELGRFLVNSTFGLGGLFDIAGRYGKVPKRDEDFGQTLGRYQVKQGPYLVLPLLGPSSLRDTGGIVVDSFLDPVNWLVRDWTLLEQAGLKGGQTINFLSLDDDNYEKIKRDALDPYLFMRAAYAQHRLAKVAK